MRDSPRSPKAKTNGSSREGNRIINPHSRIPKSTNKQTNKQASKLFIDFCFVLLKSETRGGFVFARVCSYCAGVNIYITWCWHVWACSRSSSSSAPAREKHPWIIRDHGSSTSGGRDNTCWTYGPSPPIPAGLHVRRRQRGC